MNQPAAEKKKPGSPTAISLPPDIPILMQARIEAGNRNIKLKNVASLLMHDAVLAMEFLQSANSAIFGGAAITDLDGALVRLGSARVVVELSDMYAREQTKDEDIAEIFDVLRYQSRRVSIVSLIIASALRPQLATLARVSGLFSEIGHMVGLMHLGKTYVDALKQHQRKNLPFRLEKDHKFDLDGMRVKYLRNKGIPEKLLIPYDLEIALKAPADVDLRACVRSAIAIVDAFDNQKFPLYSPDKQLPSQSDLRLLKMTPIQHEKLYKTIGEYLRKTSESEAPEGASMLISSGVQTDVLDLNEGNTDQVKVPHYPITSVKPKSRDKLEDFFNICEQSFDEGQLKSAAIDSLTRSGIFLRAALVRVPSKTNQAVVEYSQGLDFETGKIIEISDPLSPFLLFRLDIKSFNASSKSAKAPVGSSAFAIGPIGISPEGDKTLLYADASVGHGLTMESRAVFRLAMNLLISRIDVLRSTDKVEAAG